MPGVQFANANIADFYLMTPLEQPKYAKIKMSNIMDKIIKEYNLRDTSTPNG